MKYFILILVSLNCFACENIIPYCDEEIERVEKRIDAIIFSDEEEMVNDWYWFSRGQIQGYENIKTFYNEQKEKK
jgi:hypothetical protein